MDLVFAPRHCWPVVAALAVVGPAAAQPEMILHGAIRDFPRSHPDFNVVPDLGTGHYAGNLELDADTSGRPVFAGGGFKVSTQWTNSFSQPIAPHMYTQGNVVNVVSNVSGGSRDSFDSSQGPYGGSNVGPAPAVQTGSTMPTITLPDTTGWMSFSDVTYDDTTVTVSQNRVYSDRLRLEDNTVMQIDGNITMVVGELELDPDTVGSQVVLLPGSTLDLYVTDKIRIRDYGNINMNTGDPRLVTIYCLGSEDFEMREDTEVCAYVIAPNRTLEMETNTHLYGRFIGHSMSMDGGSWYHHDAPSLCGTPFGDVFGVTAGTSDGGITSAATFDQWFRDLPGVNASFPCQIRLVDQLGTGDYLFDSTSFFPADGMAYGNEGDPNNYYFTYMIRARFVFEACTGQYLSFEGDDDFWLFVDEKLALDIGGVRPGTQQHVEMDRLDLIDGQAYFATLLYAHRLAGPATFRLKTNVDLMTDTVQTFSLQVD